MVSGMKLLSFSSDLFSKISVTSKKESYKSRVKVGYE